MRNFLNILFGRNKYVIVPCKISVVAQVKGVRIEITSTGSDPALIAKAVNGCISAIKEQKVFCHE